MTMLKDVWETTNDNSLTVHRVKGTGVSGSNIISVVPNGLEIYQIIGGASVVGKTVTAKTKSVSGEIVTAVGNAEFGANIINTNDGLADLTVNLDSSLEYDVLVVYKTVGSL